MGDGVLVATQTNLGGNCIDSSVCQNVRCIDSQLVFEAQHFGSFGSESNGEPINQNVPEFSSIGILIALLAVTAGMAFLVIKKK